MILPVHILLAALLLGGTPRDFSGPSGEPASPATPEKLITQFTHRSYRREEGLPQNSVNAILQARNGYLWIGTQEGMARFDGNQFTVLNRRNTPSMRSNYVWSLMEDRTGTMWVGTNGGGITRWSASSSATYTEANGLPGSTVWCTLEDDDGALWVGTNHGLAVMYPGSHEPDSTLFHPVAGLENVFVRTIGRAPDGTLWLGTSNGPYSYTQGHLRKIRLPEDGPIHAVRRLAVGGKPKLFLAAAHSIYMIDHGLPMLFARVPVPARTPVFDMQTDTSGALWIATGGTGLWRYSGHAWSSFTEEDGLPDDQVRSLCIDREGTIWAGTYGGGLNALHNSRFTTFTHRSGLANEFILSLSESQDGSMWLGTYGGGLSRLRESTVRNYPPSSAGIPTIITSVLEDRHGVVYLGSPDLPLLRFDPRTGVVRRAAADSPVSVGCLYQDHLGRLWMGSPAGAAVLDRGHLTAYTANNSPLTAAVISIAEGADSSLWFGTQGAGLTRLCRGAFTRFASSDGVTADVVTALHAEPNGTLWIGTDGGGLIQLTDGRFHSFTTAQGLFDDVIFTILEDHAGYLWMSSNNGIFRIRKDDVDRFSRGALRSIPCQAYGTADGMKSSECNGRRQPSGWIDRDGCLWFASLNGAVMVDPTNLWTNQSLPPVTIEKIRADDAEATGTDGLVFASGTQRLTFDYTAISFIAPERIVFRFRLDGYDIDWVDAGTRRTATYTNLPPGDYRFHVIARNSDGIWNENGASAAFTLRPFFYQSRLFLIAAAGSLMLIAFAVGRLRVHRLQRREAELVAIVAERTQSLRTEKQRVEVALREAETARTEAERSSQLAEEATTLKSRLLRLVAHDLKSPLISIRGFAQIMRQQSDRNSALGEMSDMIHGLAGHLVTLINQLLNSEAIESGRMTLVLAPVDITELAREIVSSNMMFAASKRQTITFTDAGAGTCRAQADAGRLHDAFDNLVTNAVKYSPPGRTIRVSVSRTASTVRFSVQDEGPGLTAKDKKDLFGRFQRLSAQPTGGESSTGLGLSITREIVTLHHGSILVDSQEGAGSTFTIELPALP